MRIGIIMGSDSDLVVMRHVARALNELGLMRGKDFEERVISAHRTPDEMAMYAHDAKQRGIEIIVAGAGGSAHLPGMVASDTSLPVLAVAITKSPDTLNRALGSMIGMPEGKPLAVFQGEAGAYNAGLFAARILGLKDARIQTAYIKYDLALRDEVLQKDAKLKKLGAENYLKGRDQ